MQVQVVRLLFLSFADKQPSKRITKIVCFGLGDLNLRAPDAWKIQMEALPADQREAETSLITAALVHHAMALTIANVVRSYAQPGNQEIRLLTQDPNYCDRTKDILKDLGFEVVGEYGAGGFAEVDDQSLVFSPFPNAPIKQIITDIAYPLAIIHKRRDTTTGVWNLRGYVVQLLLFLALTKICFT